MDICRVVEHDYSVVNFDDETHWHECSICGAKDEESVSEHVYDAQEDGSCDECGSETREFNIISFDWLKYLAIAIIIFAFIIWPILLKDRSGV